MNVHPNCPRTGHYYCSVAPETQAASVQYRFCATLTWFSVQTGTDTACVLQGTVYIIEDNERGVLELSQHKRETGQMYCVVLCCTVHTVCTHTARCTHTAVPCGDSIPLGRRDAVDPSRPLVILPLSWSPPLGSSLSPPRPARPGDSSIGGLGPRISPAAALGTLEDGPGTRCERLSNASAALLPCCPAARALLDHGSMASWIRGSLAIGHRQPGETPSNPGRRVRCTLGVSALCARCTGDMRRVEAARISDGCVRCWYEVT